MQDNVPAYRMRPVGPRPNGRRQRGVDDRKAIQIPIEPILFHQIGRPNICRVHLLIKRQDIRIASHDDEACIVSPTRPRTLSLERNVDGSRFHDRLDDWPDRPEELDVHIRADENVTLTFLDLGHYQLLFLDDRISPGFGLEIATAGTQGGQLDHFHGNIMVLKRILEAIGQSTVTRRVGSEQSHSHAVKSGIRLGFLREWSGVQRFQSSA